MPRMCSGSAEGVAPLGPPLSAARLLFTVRHASGGVVIVVVALVVVVALSLIDVLFPGRALYDRADIGLTVLLLLLNPGRAFEPQEGNDPKH